MASHKNRIWYNIEKIDDPEELAEKLSQYTWCCCNGFRFENYLLLNDSTGPDGAQEYCVVKADTLVMVESVTTSWMSKEKLLGFLLELKEGKYDNEAYGSIEPGQVSRDINQCHHCM